MPNQPAEDASGPHVVLLGSTVDVSNGFYDGIVQRLHVEGWQVHVVSSGGELARRLFHSSASIHVLEMERKISPLADMQSLIAWYRLLARVRPDVLVVGTPKASLLGGLAGRLAKVQTIVYVAHGLRAETTGGPLGALLRWTERLTLHLADDVVAVSPSLQRAIEIAHPSVRDRVGVLRSGSMNGVDVTRFAPPTQFERESARESLSLARESFVIGFVGRMNADKGGRFLLDLLSDPRLKQVGVHLLIVGDIEDVSLQPRIDVLSSEGRLTMTGWTENPERAMAAMDLLVHPTRREGLGMVVLEAQAMGIPVVTNRVTGTTDALHDGVGGRFATLDSLEDWVLSIRELAVAPGVRKMLGVNGRAFVQERFERGAVVATFADYMRGVRGRRPANPSMRHGGRRRS